MTIQFSKMHGLGNDFVVLDGIAHAFALNPEQIRRIADRHFGVGCDQVLLVEAASAPGVDFRYRIFNADGAEVEQCGNGARCFARFVRQRGLTNKDEIVVATNTGMITLRVLDDDQVEVDMGRPRLQPAQIPFLAEYFAPSYDIEADGAELAIGAVSMGNPHAVLRVDDVDSAPVERLGPLLESHPRFPEKANIGFMQVMSREHIRLRVFERGVGETLACGSGACAAVVSGCLRGFLDHQVCVGLLGGELRVYWGGMGDQADAAPEPVLMSGPAAHVFEGEIAL